MSLKVKILISMTIFSLLLISAMILNVYEKREFYPIDDVSELLGKDDFVESMVPFEPREYIRKVSVQE